MKGIQQKQKICLGFASLAMLLLSTTLQAQVADWKLLPLVYDAKTYPGIHCEAQSVAQINDFTNLGFDMFNATQGRKHVVCPIVRDNTSNTNGTHSVYVYVSNPANRTIECTLYSYDRYSGLIDSDTNSTSNPGDQTIFLDVDNSIERGYYGINCRLPQNGAIRSYEVREFHDTDEDGGLLLP